MEAFDSLRQLYVWRVIYGRLLNQLRLQSQIRLDLFLKLDVSHIHYNKSHEHHAVWNRLMVEQYFQAKYGNMASNSDSVSTSQRHIHVWAGTDCVAKVTDVYRKCSTLNTLRPRWNGQHFADDILKRIFFNEYIWISHTISLKFVRKGTIINISALDGAEPLWKSMMGSLQTHKCVTWPQWVGLENIQYIPRNMHTVFALLCFVVVIHWLIFPYPSGLLH